MPFDTNKKYWTVHEVADYASQIVGLHTTASSLRTLITRGGGPKYHKFSRMVRYTREAVDEWLASRLSPEKSNSLDKGGANAGY